MVFAALGTSSANSETDSLKEIRPMFVNHGSGFFTNDTSLNIHPSISAADSLFTERLLHMEKSLFSSRASHSARQSSHFSNTGSGSKRKGRFASGAPCGQTLPILESTADASGGTEGPSIPSQAKAIADKLHGLWQVILYIVNQYTDAILTLSATIIGIIYCLKEHSAYMDSAAFSVAWDFNAYSNDDVRRILKTYLHFYDNLLREDAYVRLRLLLCEAFNDFNATLKSTTRHLSLLVLASAVKPCNFAIGVNDGLPHKSEASIRKVMDKIAGYGCGVKEQNGSFIAPIARGISKDMNVLCLYFGYRSTRDNHCRVAASVQDLYDDVHVIVAKNRIELAASAVAPANVESFVSQDSANFSHEFKPPFRIPSDSLRPPMSVSLSTESSARISGTMGGFIYPIIDKTQQPHLLSYADSKFALSCGHVCLDDKGEGSEYPYISSPLAVLISFYKNALLNEHNKFSQGGSISGLDSSVAYSSIISQIDELFPVKKIKSLGKTSQGTPAARNLPRTRFGQIIWGERTLIQAKGCKNGALLDCKRLSDLAIIKVNKKLNCDQNYLGDDVAFSEFDPSLMFDNLYVRKIIDLRRSTKESQLSSVCAVDSMVSTSTRNGDGTYSMNGLPVFKYGSTTKFTRGNLNGIKLVYWMDGAIHSSEFVVNSADNTTSFAAGGDSGAWILVKLEDVRGTPEAKGLGVAGMLHSYDGEYRQFGLFTPMAEILDRLEEVTKIKWGVVGVPEKHEEIVRRI